MVPSPEVVNAIAGLGSTSLFVVALFAFVTGKVRRESEVKDIRAEGEARLTEMRGDRDEWKAIANNSLAALARQTDVMEAITGKSRT